MTEGWRHELRRLEQRRLAFWAVLVSLLVHLLILVPLLFLPAKTRPAPAGEDAIWFDLSEIKETPLPSAGRLLTEPAASQANRRRPERADYLAARDNATERETHLAGLPTNESTNAVGPRSRGRPGRTGSRVQRGSRTRRWKVPKVGEGMRRRGAGSQREKEKKGSSGRKGKRASVDELIDSVAFDRGEGGGGGNFSPFNPDAGVPGDAISLNTKSFKYIGYFAGVKEKIEWAWVYPQRAQQMGQQGILTITFTILRSGGLKEVRAVRSSGFPLLDQAAMRAVRDAARFAPFPEGWPDEQITIVANFHYRLVGTKSIF